MIICLSFISSSYQSLISSGSTSSKTNHFRLIKWRSQIKWWTIASHSYITDFCLFSAKLRKPKCWWWLHTQADRFFPAWHFSSLYGICNGNSSSTWKQWLFYAVVVYSAITWNLLADCSSVEGAFFSNVSQIVCISGHFRLTTKGQKRIDLAFFLVWISFAA